MPAQIRLQKSRLACQKKFKDLPALPTRFSPIDFRPETLIQDMQRIANEFCGYFFSKSGRKIAVITDYCPDLHHLVLIEMFCFDCAAKVGDIDLLFVPEENVVDLGTMTIDDPELRQEGIGSALAKTFGQYLPSGTQLILDIDEYTTRRFVLDVMARLMQEGKISDWRFGSSQRPKPEPGKEVLMPASDNQVIQQSIFQFGQIQRLPVFSLVHHFGAAVKNLEVGLDDHNRFFFNVEAEFQRV